MIYTKDWAFIHIPKTSGINLKANAEKYMEVVQPFDRHSKDFQVLKNMHNPYWYFEDLIKDKWTFSIVRNPYTRIVSQFLFYKKNGFQLDNLTSFLQSKKTGIWGSNSTQKSFLLNSKGEVIPEVFKMESELNILEKRLGFTFTQTKINTLPYYDYKEYLTKNDKKIIEKVFREDFEQFGY